MKRIGLAIIVLALLILPQAALGNDAEPETFCDVFFKPAMEGKSLKKVEVFKFNLNKSDMRILRNAIYARHGRPFQSVELQTYFYDKKKPCGMKFKVDPNYSEDKLSKTDKSNIMLIKKWEAEKKK